MRVEVGTVKKTSAVVLVAAGAACTYGLLALHPEVSASSQAAHFSASYGLTMLSFAAFPRSRRTEIVKVGVLIAALAEMAPVAFSHGLSWECLGADILGAFAVMVPSFMERFRSLTRADPHEPFSMVYPNDRRRTSRRLAGGLARNAHSPI